MRILKPIILLFFMLNSIQLCACSCVGEFIVSKAFKISDKVFLAKVYSVKLKMVNRALPEGLQDSFYINQVKLVVEECFKGKYHSDTILIYTGIGGGDCGVDFKVGSNILVYSTKIKSPLGYDKYTNYTSICHGTKKKIKNNELHELRRKRCFFNCRGKAVKKRHYIGTK